MGNFLKDLRFGARMLLKDPGSTAISVVALTLGIGLSTFMFSVVYGALFRGLPFEQPEELVHIAMTAPERGITQTGVSIHDFEDIRAAQRAFEEMGAYYTGTLNLVDGDAPERLDGGFMTPGTFQLLGVEPVAGRLFDDTDMAPGADPALLLGYDLWQNRYGGERSVLGRAVRVNGRPATIVGVLPPGFAFPVVQQAWVPLPLRAAELPRGQGQSLNVIARLRHDVNLDQARVSITQVTERLEAAYPETNAGLRPLVRRFTEEAMDGETSAVLYTMLGAVLMVLLVACANVANILIARASLRSKEVGIRTALGAGKGRIVVQFLTEAFAIALAGAALGLVVAFVALRWFTAAIADTSPPFWLTFQLDGASLLFVLAATLTATFAAGVIPALQAARANTNDILKDESRGGSSFRMGKLSRGLVVVEIALSCGLLVGAGLLIRTIVNLRTIDMGVETEVFTARLGLPTGSWEDEEERRRFWEELAVRLAAVPGAEAAALGNGMPGMGGAWRAVRVEGESYDETLGPPSMPAVPASGRYFDVFGIQPLEGRTLAPTDRRGTQPVAVVTASFARDYLEGRALGRRIRFGTEAEEPWRTVVGVVPDLYLSGVDNDTPQGVFYPVEHEATAPRFLTLMVRGRGDPLSFTPAVRQAVQEQDRDLPLYWVRTLADGIRENNWQFDVVGAIFGVFGLAALFLAGVGLYGVMAFSVSQRTRELGVRMALGAERRDVLRMVFRQGMSQLALGLLLGLALALPLSGLMRVMLVDVEARDPATFVTVLVVLAVAATAASLIPALRATRVEPMQALRYE